MENQTNDQGSNGGAAPAAPRFTTEPSKPETQAPQAPVQPAPDGAVVNSQLRYAGFWIRFAALAVDVLIVGVAMSVVSFVVTHTVGFTLSSSMGNFIASLVELAYFIYMTHVYQATLGKKMVGIKVVAAEGTRLSLGSVTIRELSKIISSMILLIGYIMAAFTDKKQALHDMIAGSVVVYDDSKPQSKAGLVIAIIIAVLLPLIAILGILSTIVLVSLGTARAKGNEARMKSYVSQSRAFADVYANQHGDSYGNASSCDQGMFIDANIKPLFEELRVENSVTCLARDKAFVVSAKGKAPDAVPYCTDADGYFGPGAADPETVSCKAMR